MAEQDKQIIEYILRARKVLNEVIYEFNDKYNDNQPMIVEVAKMIQLNDLAKNKKDNK